MSNKKGEMIGMGLFVLLLGSLKNKTAKQQTKEHLDKLEELGVEGYNEWRADQEKKNTTGQEIIYALSIIIGVAIALLLGGAFS